MQIKVGRMLVKFVLAQDENLYQDEHTGGWIAEYRVCRRHEVDDHGNHEYRYTWERLGTYGCKEEAAKALYVERSDFSAAYGAT